MKIMSDSDGVSARSLLVMDFDRSIRKLVGVFFIESFEKLEGIITSFVMFYWIAASRYFPKSGFEFSGDLQNFGSFAG